jgi:hypothetical protein
MLEPLETSTNKTVLVRFKCGCIGLPPTEQSPLVICYCGITDEDDNFTLNRLMIPNEPHTFTSLPVEEEELILDDLRQLLHDGRRFRALKQILRS